jgi:hypothetical protein
MLPEDGLPYANERRGQRWVHIGRNGANPSSSSAAAARADVVSVARSQCPNKKTSLDAARQSDEGREDHADGHECRCGAAAQGACIHVVE